MNPTTNIPNSRWLEVGVEQLQYPSNPNGLAIEHGIPEITTTVVGTKAQSKTEDVIVDLGFPDDDSVVNRNIVAYLDKLIIGSSNLSLISSLQAQFPQVIASYKMIYFQSKVGVYAVSANVVSSDANEAVISRVSSQPVIIDVTNQGSFFDHLKPQ